MPSEVAACAIQSVVRLAVRQGFPGAAELVPPELRGQRRVDWAFYAQLLERFVELAGGIDEATRLAGNLHLEGGQLDWIVSSRFSAKHLYRQACELAPRAWRNLQVELDAREDELRIHARLIDGVDCAAFFLVSRSSIAELPQRAGLGAAEVAIEELTGRSATWRVRPPADPAAAVRPDPVLAYEHESQALRELGRELAMSDDAASFTASLQRILREHLGLSPVELAREPRPGSLEVRLRGAPVAWLAASAEDRQRLGPLLPWIALGLDRIDTLARSRETALADQALHTLAGAAFIAEASGRIVWSNGAGWAWLAAARGGAARVASAAKARASEGEFIVRPMGGLDGHVVLTLSDPQRDARDRASAAAAAWKLTPTEALVLGEVLTGRSNKEIGLELGMAEATVEVHMTRIFRKAGIQGRSSIISRVWSTAW